MNITCFNHCPGGFLLAAILAASSYTGTAALLWIEGESATQKNVYPNAGLDEVDVDELSGGAWISSFSENGKRAGVVGYVVKIDRPGQYTLWVRANNRATGLAFRVDSPQWVPVQAKAMADEDKAAREQWQQIVRAV